MRAAVWNARSALLYSVGGWTALGGMLHYSYSSGGGAEGGGGPENESDPQANEAISREVTVTDTPIGIQITTVTTYNKNFVPPLTRLLRRMTSFFDSNEGPPSEN